MTKGARDESQAKSTASAPNLVNEASAGIWRKPFPCDGPVDARRTSSSPFFTIRSAPI
jgi:hypothetical protein